MNSSPKPTHSPLEPPFVREAGVPYRAAEKANGFQAWISLMEAVEALCPRWPERPPATGGDYRL